MKITIYELLGLIKDGKAPKKIKCENVLYNLEFQNTITGAYEYKSKHRNCLLNNMVNRLYLTDILKTEVEIIEEEKKIEKLEVALLGQCDNWLRCPTSKVTKQDIEINPYIIENVRENTLYFQRKINELIEEIEKLKGKSE